MAETANVPGYDGAVTEAVRQALSQAPDHTSLADLLFLERWELAPVHGPAAALRVSQIRRANPALAEQVRAEIARARAALRPGRGA